MLQWMLPALTRRPNDEASRRHRDAQRHGSRLASGGGLVLAAHTFASTHSAEIVAMANRFWVPSDCPLRAFEGGRLTTILRIPAIVAVPLLWAAFTVLVLATLYVLLPACGLVLPGYGSWQGIGPDYCLAWKPSAARADAERTNFLRNLVGQLELQVARRQLACLTQVPPAPSAPRLPQAAESDRPRPSAPEIAGRERPLPPGQTSNFPDHDRRGGEALRAPGWRGSARVSGRA